MADSKSALNNFIRENTAGALNKVFLASAVLGIATAENKTKALFRALKDLAAATFLVKLGLTGAFAGTSKAVGAILRDTGSLDAALRRMQNIQGFQRLLAPLLGGLGAAKQRAAELIAFSARTPFRFEDVAGGQRSLLSSTRGSFGDNKALTTIGDAAAASGNSFESTANAVGSFYEALRSGAPVAAASEQLRQMGLLSQAAADDLDKLQASGASNTQVFERLTKTLNENAGAMAGMRDDLQSVTDAHDKAADAMKVAFGESFTEQHVQNIKNGNAAMIAITPVVARLGQFFATFTNALSGMKSEIIRNVAESKAFQVVLEFLPKLILATAAATSVWAGASLALQAGAIAAGASFTGLLSPLNLLLTKLPLAGTAVRLLAGSFAALSVIGVVVTAATVLLGYINSINKAAERVREMAKAHLEAENAIRKQIEAMKTLADFHEAVAAAAAAEQKAQEELAEARKKAGEEYDKYNYGNPLLIGKSAEEKARRRESAVNENEDVRGAEAAAGKARANSLRAVKHPTESLTSEARQQLARQAAQRAIAAEEDEYQRKLSAGTGNRAELIQNRAGVLARREAEAEAGRKAIVANENRQTALENKISIAKAGGNQKETERLQQELERSGLQAPRTSSLFMRTRAQLLRDNKLDEGARPRGLQLAEASRLDIQAEIAASREADISQPSKQLANEAAQTAREQRADRIQESLQLRAGAAQRGGRYDESVSLRDEAAFGEHFEQLRGRGVGEDEARKRALALTNEGIQQSIRPQGLGVVADSLQRIGGGGGAYAPGGDQVLQVAKRQTGLLKEARDFLEMLVKEKKDQGVF